MKIYLASQFKEQETMIQWSILLREHNHFITSRWLFATEELTNTSNAYDAAKVDLEDIDEAECLISSTLNRGELFTGGGRHIEYGYALAKRKKLINVGGFESVFHNLAITVPYIKDVLPYLK